MEVGDVDLAGASARLGETFRIHVDDGTVIDLELVDVERARSSPSGVPSDSSFSMLFRGPADPLLNQGMIPLHNDTWGTCEIFLVPVSQEQSGTVYEAVFSRDV